MGVRLGVTGRGGVMGLYKSVYALGVKHSNSRRLRVFAKQAICKRLLQYIYICHYNLYNLVIVIYII